MFATGEAGRATRLLGPLLGAPVAYAAWDAARVAAPGQYLPEEVSGLIGHLGGRPSRLFAVLRSKAGASLSPRLHAAAYRALALPNAFVPLEVAEPAELDALLRPAGESCLDGLGFSVGGFAVAMPWKGEAARRCTLVAPRARRAEAVNTVLPRPGKVLGDCTDIDGITRVLAEEGVELRGSRALVLGAGGAARAAVVALQLAGARVAIVARDADRARETAAGLGAVVTDMGASERAAVVINATPAGADGRPDAWLESLRLPRGRRGRGHAVRRCADVPGAARRDAGLAFRERPRGAALPGDLAVRGDDRRGAAGAGHGGSPRARRASGVSGAVCPAQARSPVVVETPRTLRDNGLRPTHDRLGAAPQFVRSRAVLLVGAQGSAHPGGWWEDGHEDSAQHGREGREVPGPA